MLDAGETLLHEAVQMSLRVGLVNPNDHIVVVQMISDAFVVKVGAPQPSPLSTVSHVTKHANFPFLVEIYKIEGVVAG